MTAGKRLFLTGATGILGGWVLCEALQQGYRPTVLMRDVSHDRARERICKVLALGGCEAGPDAVAIMHGDVSRPSLGLNAAEVSKLRAQTDLFVHCAASVSFDPRQDKQVLATNVHGVQHVLDVLEGTDIPLHHVSTAYVSGTRSGLVREDDLDKGQDFKNAYERSKFEAETLVREAFRGGTHRGSVLRPSIIVGATSGGRISQFLNFYAFMKVMEAAKSGRIRCQGPMRVAFPPHCTKNVIPVDWTARALLHIVQNETPDGRTYHLTNPHPVSHKSLLDWANTKLNPHGVILKSVERLDSACSTLERLGHFSLHHYRPYLRQEAVYCRKNVDAALAGALPFPETNHAFFDTLYDYAHRQAWQDIFTSHEARGSSVPEARRPSKLSGNTVLAQEA